MDVDLRDLRLLVTVHETGFVDEAAAALGSTAARVHLDLERLDRLFEGPLFERFDDALHVTALGHQIALLARAILADYDLMRHELEGWATTTEEPLRLGAHTPLLLGAWVADLARLLPSRSVRPATETSSTALTRMLLEGELDVATVCVHPGHDDEAPPGVLEQVYVEREPQLFLVSVDHPLATKPQLGFADLRSEAWLLPPGEPDGTHFALQDCFARAGFSPPAPLGRVDTCAYGDYVAGGLAVGITLPTEPPPPGTIAVPVRGDVLSGRLALRWRPDSLSPEDAEIVTRAAATAYARQLLRAGGRQRWWTRSPEHRPVMAAGFRELLDP